MLWNRCIRDLQAELPEQDFNTWIRPLQAVEDGAILRLLAPIAPHVTHQLWVDLGYGDDIQHADWPQVDENALKQDNIEIVVQVNGKVRGKISVPADADKGAVENAAKENENVVRFTEGKTIRKVIVVPGKLVNIVAN